MEIDIRNHHSDEAVNVIRFGGHDILYPASDVIVIASEKNSAHGTSIYKKDIDNLILALQKAKELWGDK